jgi:hypothetical protein
LRGYFAVVAFLFPTRLPNLKAVGWLFDATSRAAQMTIAGDGLIVEDDVPVSRSDRYKVRDGGTIRVSDLTPVTAITGELRPAG